MIDPKKKTQAGRGDLLPSCIAVQSQQHERSKGEKPTRLLHDLTRTRSATAGEGELNLQWKC